MKQVEVAPVRDLESGYRAPSCIARGEAMSRLVAPDAYSLWLVRARVEAGTELRWTDEHGDEVLYVLSGGLTVDGARCQPGTAAIVEAGVPAIATAGQPTEIVHVGPTSPIPPSEGLTGPASGLGRRVHVEDDPPIRRPVDHDVSIRIFADSACPTCRVNFFRVDGQAGYRTGSHVHSEDEIIYVVTGELRIGPQRAPADTAVAVPGGRRYGFEATRPFTILNYRRDVSTVTRAPGDEPRVEFGPTSN